MDEATKITDSFLAAKKEIYDKWEHTGLLKGIDDEHTAIQVAALMENQRLMNERFLQKEVTPRLSKFVRTTIPLIRRVYGPFIPNKLVSVQSQISPTAVFLWKDKYGSVQRRETAVKTRNLKTRSFAQEGIDESLDEEAARTAVWAKQLHDEFCREIAHDLRQHAGINFKHTWKDATALLEHLTLAATKHRANWLYMSLDVAQKLADVEDGIDVSLKSNEDVGIEFFGLLDNWNVYVDSLYPTSSIVMGRRGVDYTDAGYFYGPFVPLAEVELETEWAMHTRYAKVLLNADYYARFDIDGYSNEVEQQEMLQEVTNG